jgi:hypothetical protein
VSTRNLFAGTVEANALWVGGDQANRTVLLQTAGDPGGTSALGGSLALDTTLGAAWLNVATLGAPGTTWARLLVGGYSVAGGDLAGTYPNPTVDGIQGRPVSGTAPAINESLTWDGTAWVPQAVGAGALAAVYGQFYSNLDQPISSGTGISIMTFEVTSGANGVSVVDPGTGPSRITVAQAGKYSFCLSPQILKTAGGGSGLVTFWIRKQGNDEPDTASFIGVTNNQHALPFVEILLDMGAGQYIEWAANSNVANVQLEHEPASVAPAVVRPAAPSIIATVKRLGA